MTKGSGNSGLIKDSFIYIIGEFVNKAFPFFLLPLLTRYLSPEDYGIYASFSIFISILVIFVGVNTHGAITVNYYKLQKEEIRVYIANSFIILAFSFFLVLIISLIFNNTISALLSIPSEWILLAVILAGAQFITIINLLLWTVEKDPKSYSLYQIAQSILLLLLTLIFIVGLEMKWEGQVLAKAISGILFALISFGFILKRNYMVMHLDKDYLKDALSFGIPLVPYSLATWVRNGVDKFYIVSILGASAMGLYAVGYQVGLILGVLVTAVNKAWSPYVYTLLNQNPSFIQKRKLVVITYLYGAFLIVSAFLLGNVAYSFMSILVGENFKDASEFVVWIALAYAFLGVNNMVSVYLFYLKKTKTLAINNVIFAIFHIILVYFCIQNFGSIGAAYATSVTFFLSFLSTWWLSHKSYPMPWNIFKSEIK